MLNLQYSGYKTTTHISGLSRSCPSPVWSTMSGGPVTVISTQLPGCRRVLLVLFQTDFIKEIFLFNNKCISLLADTDNRETFLVRPNFHHSFYIGISIDLRTLEIQFTSTHRKNAFLGWLVRILVPLKKNPIRLFCSLNFFNNH